MFTRVNCCFTHKILGRKHAPCRDVHRPKKTEEKVDPVPDVRSVTIDFLVLVHPEAVKNILLNGKPRHGPDPE